MQKTAEFSIDGDDYRITTLGAKVGRRLWFKLMKVIAPVIKEITANGAEGGITGPAAIAGIAEAFKELDDDLVDELCEAYGATCGVRVMGDKGERWPNLDGVLFDQHFSGRYLSMSKWLLQCTLINFADFLGDTSLGAMTERIKAKVAAPRSPSPTA